MLGRSAALLGSLRGRHGLADADEPTPAPAPTPTSSTDELADMVMAVIEQGSLSVDRRSSRWFSVQGQRDGLHQRGARDGVGGVTG